MLPDLNVSGGGRRAPQLATVDSVSGEKVNGEDVDRRPSTSSPIAEAMQWVSRITTVGLMMVLPAIGGRWLDERRGTSYWALIGLVLGLTVGLWQLLQIAGGKPRRNVDSSEKKSSLQKPSSSSDSIDA